MWKLLIFEDLPFRDENDQFHMHLEDQLEELEVQIDQTMNVPSFEREIVRRDYDVLVLDIMALAPVDFRWTQTGDDVPDTLVGVELLYRCRKGVYGDQYINVPIYMRTARGESDVRQYCKHLGATGCLDPGVDDMKLISKIKEHFAVASRV